MYVFNFPIYGIARLHCSIYNVCLVGNLYTLAFWMDILQQMSRKWYALITYLYLICHLGDHGQICHFQPPVNFLFCVRSPCLSFKVEMRHERVYTMNMWCLLHIGKELCLMNYNKPILYSSEINRKCWLFLLIFVY